MSASDPARATTKPTGFGFATVFTFSEVFGLALVFFLAALAGLQADVFAEAGSGNWVSYVPLFAWGLAADQTKNLLQNLTTYVPNR